MTTAQLTPTTPTIPTENSGWRARYRAAYSKLPPGVQMIGLQVWLPILFVILFCFCYIFAFHAPTPHDVPVAVVGTTSSTESFASTLQDQSKGALQVHTEPSIEAARADVRSGEMAAAYVPGATSAHLVIASAAQFQLATLAKQYFTPVAAAAKVPLTVEDLAPLPARDSFGTALFYMTLVWLIGGYMMAMFVGLMGGMLGHKVRIGILAGASAILPLLSTLLLRFVLGVVDSHFFALWAIGAGTAFAVGLVVNGLSYFTGRFVTGVALGLFVFINIPASGGAFPPELMPEPFRFLHPFVAGTGTVDLLRHTVYNVGPGLGTGWLILVGYAVVGAILTFLGKPYAARRMRRRAERGAPPAMMAAAQAAATAAFAANHAKAVEAKADPVPEYELEEQELETSEFRADEADTDAIAAVTGSEV